MKRTATSPPVSGANTACSVQQTACKSMPESKEITEGSACYGWRRDFRMRVVSLQIRQLQGSMCTSSKQT